MIIDQLFTPKPLEEGGPYDLPGKDYDRPGDIPRKSRPQGDTSPRRHDDDPDFMDPDQRKLRADQARVAKANAEYQAKKKQDMAEAAFMHSGQSAPSSGIGGTAKYGYGLNDIRNARGKNPEIDVNLRKFKAWINGGPKPVDINDVVQSVEVYFTNVNPPSDARVSTAFDQILNSQGQGWVANKNQAMLLNPSLDAAIAEPLPNQRAGNNQNADGYPIAPSRPMAGQAVQAVQAAQAAQTAQATQQQTTTAPVNSVAPAGKKFNTAGATTVTPRPVTRPALPNPRLREQGVAEKAGDLRPKLGSARDKGKSVRKWRNDRGLNEAMLMEDPIYRDFKRVGQYISEQKLTEPEILQIFSNAETGMTDKATGANRTFVGRGKDATVDFAKDVSNSLSGVLKSIQDSVPVAAVDVAYDQATDALANLTGGQKGAAMAAIKKYRNLVKEYPKTAGFAKAALVAIAGLATGGAGLPAIAGLTYALDSAIKGDKLSSVIGKGAGTAALAAAGQGIYGGATQTGPADTSAFTNVNQMGDYTGEYVSMPDGSDTASALVAPAPELATYTVQQGDTLSQIAERFNTTVQELVGLNPQLSAASGATGGQGLNPDVIFPGQQITLPPGTPGADVYAGGVGTNADTMADIARGQVPNSAITQGMAARNAVKESIKFKIIPASKLIDQKATVLNWALNESVSRKSNSVNLTTIGTYTVFENVDRYRRAIVEYTQPGREQIPNLLRPDMPGAPVTPDTNPGMIGRGLNALDRFTSKVGGGLSNFGRQFTTGVTKEKLKMNWQQDGKPTDSDQLAAWLVTQKVPQEVVTSVFSNMSIPYTAPTTQPTAQPAAQAAAPKTGGASTQAYAGINPATKKPWTQQELRDKFYPEPAANSTDDAEDTTGGGAGAFASMAGRLDKPSTTTSSTGGTTSVDQAKGITTNRASANNPNRLAATAAGGTGTATNPDVAAAYSASLKAGKPASIPKSTATPNTMGMRRTNVKKPIAPTATNVTSTYGPGFKNSNQPAVPKEDPQAEIKKALDARRAAGLFAENRIAAALKRPVAEMLQMVETKEDVYRIKQFVDDTFVKYGAVNESAFAIRNKIIEHVTQAGAQRRREHSRKVAH